MLQFVNMLVAAKKKKKVQFPQTEEDGTAQCCGREPNMWTVVEY